MAPAPVGRAAVADDYRWFAADTDLTKGFCFTWVQNLVPQQILDRLGATELERVGWRQLVGSGDGQLPGADRFFFGVARVDDWSLIVEDAGALGATDALARPLSAGTRLVSHYRDGAGRGRFLLLADQETELDFDPIEPGRRAGLQAQELAPILEAAGFTGVNDTAAVARGPSAVATAAAFALTERVTGIAMTLELLTTRTYVLATVPHSLAGAP
jgi:hypothetical protein